jgi:hypothetical protein
MGHAQSARHQLGLEPSGSFSLRQRHRIGLRLLQLDCSKL